MSDLGKAIVGVHVAAQAYRLSELWMAVHLKLDEILVLPSQHLEFAKGPRHAAVIRRLDYVVRHRLHESELLFRRPRAISGRLAHQPIADGAESFADPVHERDAPTLAPSVGADRESLRP